MMTTKNDTIRLDATQGGISAKTMVLALARSFGSLDGIKLVEQLSAVELAEVKAELAK